jgi:putative ABC transport system permease protein
MFDLDRWQEIYYTLKANKLRTFLTAFGVFWGIFMLVIMLGSGKGLENGITQGMGDFATNSVFIWGNRTTMPYKGFQRGRWIGFNNEDTKALRMQIPEIEVLAPRVEVQSWDGKGQNNIVRGLKTGAYSIMGDYPDFNRIDPITVKKGRFINDIDVLQLRKVVVIGERVYNALFNPGEEPIGQYIRIKGVYFQVIGVFKSRHSGGWAEWQENSVFLPFTTLQKTYNYGNAVHWFSITSKSNVPVSKVEEKAKNLLKKRHFVAPDDNEAVGSENVEKNFNQVNMLFLGIGMLIWIVGLGTLFAGIIGVSNIMLVIVKERTKEIGIQRSIGASPLKVIGQIMTESVVLTTIAGLIGLVFGVIILEVVNFSLIKSGANLRMFTHPEINFMTAVSALFILVLSGMFAGLIPARRAVKIKPIDALRSE